MPASGRSYKRGNHGHQQDIRVSAHFHRHSPPSLAMSVFCWPCQGSRPSPHVQHSCLHQTVTTVGGAGATPGASERGLVASPHLSPWQSSTPRQTNKSEGCARLPQAGREFYISYSCVQWGGELHHHPPPPHTLKCGSLNTKTHHQISSDHHQHPPSLLLQPPSHLLLVPPPTLTLTTSPHSSASQLLPVARP